LDLAQALRNQDIEQRGGREQSAYEEALAAELRLGEHETGFGDSPEVDGVVNNSASEQPSWRNGSRLDDDREARRNARALRPNANRSSRLREDPDVQEVPEPTMPGEPVDRRIGRWRTGGGS
jgi:hypothetical protein